MSDRDQKTEQATAKRKRENRKKGMVAKSPTLVSWVSLLVATYVLPAVFSNVGSVLSTGVASVRDIAADPEPGRMLAIGRQLVVEVLGAVAPLFIVAVVIAVVGNIAQVGLMLNGSLLKPKFERINPGKGIKRLLSVKSLWETGKQVVTLLVILAVSIPSVIAMANSLLGSGWELSSAISSFASSTVAMVRLVAVIGVGIGAADYAWARFNLLRDQRMTKQEVKQEARESDGDPHLKAKLRSTRMAMSRNRMLASVGDASVVITNPTHVAVALSYEPRRGAPKVVATGADALAAKIRERARDAGVPVVESPPLARALHRACKVDDEIPPELFQAVATVLAFVHRLAAQPMPPAVVSLPLPDTWTPAGEDPGTSLKWRPGGDRRRKLAARAHRGAAKPARPPRPTKIAPTLTPLGRELTQVAARRLAERTAARSTT